MLAPTVVVYHKLTFPKETIDKLCVQDTITTFVLSITETLLTNAAFLSISERARL